MTGLPISSLQSHRAPRSPAWACRCQACLGSFRCGCSFVPMVLEFYPGGPAVEKLGGDFLDPTAERDLQEDYSEEFAYLARYYRGCYSYQRAPSLLAASPVKSSLSIASLASMVAPTSSTSTLTNGHAHANGHSHQNGQSSDSSKGAQAYKVLEQPFETVSDSEHARVRRRANVQQSCDPVEETHQGSLHRCGLLR